MSGLAMTSALVVTAQRMVGLAFANTDAAPDYERYLSARNWQRTMVETYNVLLRLEAKQQRAVVWTEL